MVISKLRRCISGEIGEKTAKELFKFVLGCDETHLLLSGENELSCEDENKIKSLADEIKSGRPIQYIIGEWDFFGKTFVLNENVLIPRSDTELLVEETIAVSSKSEKILELCTGSGCIAVSLANETEGCIVTAAELSDEAILVAQKNVSRLCKGNVRIIKADVLSDCPEKLKKSFDILVSNPPYIKTGELEKLDENVKREPKMALDGGDDGLMFYRAIAKKWKCALKDGGKILLEIGFDEADDVVKILKDNGFCNIYVIKDSGNNDRVIKGTLLP